MSPAACLRLPHGFPAFDRRSKAAVLGAPQTLPDSRFCQPSHFATRPRLMMFVTIAYGLGVQNHYRASTYLDVERYGRTCSPCQVRIERATNSGSSHIGK